MGQHKVRDAAAQLHRFQQASQGARIIQIGAEPLACPKCRCDVLVVHQLARVKVNKVSHQMQLDSAGVGLVCVRCGTVVNPEPEEPKEGLPVAGEAKTPEEPTSTVVEEKA